MAKNIEKNRKIIAFPELEDFYDALMDRLHMVTKEFFHLEEPFTLFINCIGRNHTSGTTKKVKRDENFELVYGGVKRQRAFLEPKKRKKDPELDDSWDKLARTLTYRSELDFEGGVISQGLYLEFVRDELDLSDLQSKGADKLVNYFKDIMHRTGKPKGHYREQEYTVLKSYFKIEDYHYLSLPLIQFAELDGWVYIVYHRADHHRFFKKEHEHDNEKLRERIVGDMIKAFSREYENLILSWELISEAEKLKVLNEELQKVLQPKFYKKYARNKILKELKYPEYYEQYRWYALLRNRQGRAEQTKRETQARRNAVLSILMDSYAHNISAHSLVALTTWFFKRAVYMDPERREEPDYNPENAMDQLPFITKDYNFNYDLHELMRLLLSKGAFWGGVIRDRNQGGTTRNLYDILWGTFMQNPLFLGSIAYTEGILSLQLSITVLRLEKEVEGGIVLEKRVLADGALGCIDLRNWAVPSSPQNRKEYQSGFLQKGPMHEALRAYLESFKVFFPGGIVGEHAFYTILENELRNVKHYAPETIGQMREKSLCLNVSVEENHYVGKQAQVAGKPFYYKIGVWLEHPVFISPEVLKKRLRNLDSDIIHKDNKAKLGGIYQDKICAAMLFNNTFASVQDVVNGRDKYFYPWIKVGFSASNELSTGDMQRDIEISARAFRREVVKSAFNNVFQGGVGYYKKYFHLWRGEDVASGGASDHAWDNVSRFRFVCADEREAAGVRILQARGIVRIVSRTCHTLEEAYRAWLSLWIAKRSENYPAIRLYMKDELLAELFWDGQRAVYNGIDRASGVQTAPNVHRLKKIKLAHGHGDGKGDELSMRSHGILKQVFLGGQNFETAKVPEALASELLETMETQVCIFDNRIARECVNYGLSMRQMSILGCRVFEESGKEWDKLIKQGNWMADCHFLVLHLSFIEAFKGKNKQRYSEENIHTFIDQEILAGKKRPPHFFLVVVTGRGRTKWQTTLETHGKTKDYSFVMFRSIEALINAVSDALSKGDHIDLKYFICKILFGS